jgi:hypothetical protein
MKRAGRIATGCVLLAMALAARADDFWKRKPPSQWTEEEAVRILRDSPWAKQVPFAAVPPGKEASASVSTRTADCDPDAVLANGNCLDRRLRLPRDDTQQPDISFSSFYYAIFLLRWESAAPVQEAFRRLAELGDRAGALYQSPPPRCPADRYVITMKVLRPGSDMRDTFAERPDSKEMKRVRLKTSHGTFTPSETERSGVGAGEAVHFFFPREQDGKPILDAKGGTVEFVFDGKNIFVKSKFSLDAESLR